MNKPTEMESNNPHTSELFKKVLEGMKKASRKLVEESAAQGRTLVVSINGETKSIPAKELLKQLSDKS